MNVSCNIFINSFGSIAETTMVSESKHRLLLTAWEISPPEIFTFCTGLAQGGGKSGVFQGFLGFGHFFTVLFNVLSEDIYMKMSKELGD